MRVTRRDFVRSAAVIGVAGAAGGKALGRQDAGEDAGAEERWLATSKPRPPAPERKLKILFLGGTGFLGPHAVRYALSRGHEVTLFNRGRTNPTLFAHLEQLKGDRDPQNGEGLASLGADRRWDCVIDTSGHIPRHVTASAELLRERVGQYLFVSSMCAHANWTSTPGANEDTPTSTLEDPSTEEVQRFYCEMKAECERRAEAAAPGIAHTVRPGLIVGPGDFSDRFTYWPVRVRDGGSVLAPGKPTDPAQFIDARDLAEFIILLCERREIRTYNATGPDWNQSIADILHGTKAVVGGDAAFTWIDDTSFLVENGAMPWAQLPCWTDPRDPESAGTSAWDISRALKAGLTFRPLYETIRDTLAWWDELPETRRAQMRAGLRPDHEAAILKAWDERAG